MQTVNRSMVNIVGALERSLAGNNLEKMAEVRQSVTAPPHHRVFVWLLSTGGRAGHRLTCTPHVAADDGHL
jgi:hypothetical protein